MEAEGADLGHYPVVKLFNPVGGGTWLLSEMDEQGIAFGLCDLGMGEPELGYVAIQELEQAVLPWVSKLNAMSIGLLQKNLLNTQMKPAAIGAS